MPSLFFTFAFVVAAVCVWASSVSAAAAVLSPVTFCAPASNGFIFGGGQLPAFPQHYNATFAVLDGDFYSQRNCFISGNTAFDASAVEVAAPTSSSLSASSFQSIPAFELKESTVRNNALLTIRGAATPNTPTLNPPVMGLGITIVSNTFAKGSGLVFVNAFPAGSVISVFNNSFAGGGTFSGLVSSSPAATLSFSLLWYAVAASADEEAPSITLGSNAQLVIEANTMSSSVVSSSSSPLLKAGILIAPQTAAVAGSSAGGEDIVLKLSENATLAIRRNIISGDGNLTTAATVTSISAVVQQQLIHVAAAGRPNTIILAKNASMSFDNNQLFARDADGIKAGGVVLSGALASVSVSGNAFVASKMGVSLAVPVVVSAGAAAASSASPSFAGVDFNGNTFSLMDANCFATHSSSSTITQLSPSSASLSTVAVRASVSYNRVLVYSSAAALSYAGSLNFGEITLRGPRSQLAIVENSVRRYDTVSSSSAAVNTVPYFSFNINNAAFVAPANVTVFGNVGQSTSGAGVALFSGGSVANVSANVRFIVCQNRLEPSVSSSSSSSSSDHSDGLLTSRPTINSAMLNIPRNYEWCEDEAFDGAGLHGFGTAFGSGLGTPQPSQAALPQEKVVAGLDYAILGVGVSQLVCALKDTASTGPEFFAYIVMMNSDCNEAEHKQYVRLAMHLLAPLQSLGTAYAVIGNVAIVAAVAVLQVVLVTMRVGGGGSGVLWCGGGSRSDPNRHELRAACASVFFPAATLFTAVLMYAGTCYYTALLLIEANVAPSAYASSSLSSSSNTTGSSSSSSTHGGTATATSLSDTTTLFAVVIGVLTVLATPIGLLFSLSKVRYSDYKRYNRDGSSMFLKWLIPSGRNTEARVFGPAIVFAETDERYWAAFPMLLGLIVGALSAFPSSWDCKKVHIGMACFYAAAIATLIFMRPHRSTASVLLSLFNLMGLCLLSVGYLVKGTISNIDFDKVQLVSGAVVCAASVLRFVYFVCLFFFEGPCVASKGDKTVEVEVSPRTMRRRNTLKHNLPLGADFVINDDGELCMGTSAAASPNPNKPLFMNNAGGAGSPHNNANGGGLHQRKVSVFRDDAGGVILLATGGADNAAAVFFGDGSPIRKGDRIQPVCEQSEASAMAKAAANSASPPRLNKNPIRQWNHQQDNDDDYDVSRHIDLTDKHIGASSIGGGGYSGINQQHGLLGSAADFYVNKSNNMYYRRPDSTTASDISGSHASGTISLGGGGGGAFSTMHNSANTTTLTNPLTAASRRESVAESEALVALTSAAINAANGMPNTSAMSSQCKSGAVSRRQSGFSDVPDGARGAAEDSGTARPPNGKGNGSGGLTVTSTSTTVTYNVGAHSNIGNLDILNKLKLAQQAADAVAGGGNSGQVTSAAAAGSPVGANAVGRRRSNAASDAGGVVNNSSPNYHQVHARINDSDDDGQAEADDDDEDEDLEHRSYSEYRGTSEASPPHRRLQQRGYASTNGSPNGRSNSRRRRHSSNAAVLGAMSQAITGSSPKGFQLHADDEVIGGGEGSPNGLLHQRRTVMGQLNQQGGASPRRDYDF